MYADVCGRGSQTFTSNGSFIVPRSSGPTVQVQVVAIGGGGGGTNGHMPGGGGGYLASGTFNVSSNSTVPVTVGSGGTGAFTTVAMDNTVAGNTKGSASRFGDLLVANGGNTWSFVPSSWCAAGHGADGGSGSGCSCWGTCSVPNGAAGSGGSGGLNGGNAGACATGGSGQGSAQFAAHLQLATLHAVTAGAGGVGGLGQIGCYLPFGYGPSGGGGGILIDGNGPVAQNGALINRQIKKTRSIVHIFKLGTRFSSKKFS